MEGSRQRSADLLPFPYLSGEIDGQVWPIDTDVIVRARSVRSLANVLDAIDGHLQIIDTCSISFVLRKEI